MENTAYGSNVFDIILVVIGAVLGFALSIATIIINKAMDKYGKIHLFYKIVYQKGSSQKAGFIYGVGEKSLLIPIYFEFQNTSNTARVIRDVCLYLYKNGEKVAKMNQLQYTTNSQTNEIKNNFGGDKNSYSFVLPPMSIQKQECEFLYKVSLSEVEKYSFDEIRFSYYDEKNKVNECHFCYAPNSWDNIDFNYENEYIKLRHFTKSKKNH